MALRWYSVVIESVDPGSLARWWAQALGWDVAYESEGEVVIVPAWAREAAVTTPFHRQGPGLVFVRVSHRKSAKNRLHLDFAPHSSDDRGGEIERLRDLGATAVDVGQSESSSWTVLADPEGNEFCVLSARDM